MGRLSQVDEHIRTSSLEATILNFQLPVWFQSIDTSSVGLLDLKHISITVGITRLSSPEAKIHALPV